MSEKKSLIVKVAKRLFTEQGIKSTTISQIANEAGIAKGSVYSNFDSKNEIITAIFVEEFEVAIADLKGCLDSGLEGEQLLVKYVTLIMRQIELDTTFSKMLVAEIDASINAAVVPLVQGYRQESRQLLSDLLAKVFGDAIDGWEQDLVAILDGIIMEYSTYLTFDEFTIDVDNCVRFICYVIKKTAENINQKDNDITPILSSIGDADIAETKISPVKLVEEIQQVILQSDLPNKNESLATLSALLQSLNSTEADSAEQNVIQQALIAYLPEHPLWKSEIEQLKRMMR